MSLQAFITVALGACCTLTSACMTYVHDTTLLQSKDPNGRIAYYRIHVFGYTENAQTTYRSGQYDAEAVDALFGEINNDESSTGNILHRKRAEALEATAHKYYQDLATGRDSAVVSESETRLALALRPTSEISGHDALLGDGGQRIKQVIMLNAKVAEIERAIAEFIKDKETTDTLMAAVAASKRQQYIVSHVTSDDITVSTSALGELQQEVEQAKDTADDATIRSWFDALAEMRVP